jgi:hypothetical protein
MELGFDPASEPIRASLVRFFKPAAGAEIDNAVTLVSTASTRQAVPSAALRAKPQARLSRIWAKILQ